MRPEDQARGGAAVALLTSMEAWEAKLVLNLRLWCDGPDGQAQVWKEYREVLPCANAHDAYRQFELLLSTLARNAHRPLVTNTVEGASDGSDACILVNLVRFALDGHLNDAALVATLIVGPSSAEHVALLAGEVGTRARRIGAQSLSSKTKTGPDVIRLH